MGRSEKAAKAVKAAEAGEKTQQSRQPSRGRFALQLAAALAASHACAMNAYAIGWGVAATWQLRQTTSNASDVSGGGDSGGGGDGGGSDLQLTDDQRACINSALYLGTAFGCLLGGRASARFGPRGTMLHSLLPLALGQTLVALATSAGVLLAGRLVIGLTSGLSCGVYVLYISGTSSPRYWGALTILADVICILAIIGTIALCEVLNWRWLAGFCGVISVVPTGIMLLLLPDDPVWLLSCGRLADAKRAAAAFDLELEVADPAPLDADQISGGWQRTLKLLTERKNLFPLGIVLMMVFFTSFSGYMAILSYSLEFFRQAGFQLDAAVCSILFCAIRVLSVLITSTIVDRLGRRVLLMASSGGVSLCYLGLAAYYKLPSLRQYPALPIILILGAGYVYSSGLACLPFCLAGEMFPLKMRQLGGSLVTFGYCVFNVLATLAFPRTLAALGAGGLFFAHAVIMAGACVFTLILVPETKGLSPAAIETLFDGKTRKDAPADRGTTPSGGDGGGQGGKGEGIGGE